MTTFNGMPISEDRVLALGIVFSILFLAVAVACAFLLYTSLTMRNPKEKERLRNLRKKAQNDELAKKQLEKIERKNQRRRKREKENIIADILIGSLSVCTLVAILALGVIPAWTDYAVKDHVVYTGEITVYHQMKRSRIKLEDGTTVWGIGDFDEEDTYGTVVYSRRTRQFLGGSN